jgi:hypothetical protein
MAVRKTTDARNIGPINSQPSSAPVASPVHHVPPIDDGGVHPLMIQSLPAQASGADVYARPSFLWARIRARSVTCWKTSTGP